MITMVLIWFSYEYGWLALFGLPVALLFDWSIACVIGGATIINLRNNGHLRDLL